MTARGGRIEVRPLPDGEEIVLRPTGVLRWFAAAFLAFWLCGWALGEAVALVLLLGPFAAPLVEGARELFPGLVGSAPAGPASLPLPVCAFLAVWLAAWTWGGLSAAWELLRILAGSDRYLLRPGSVVYSRRAGPFGRARELRAGAVEAVVHRPRKSQLLAVVAGKEVPLSAGVPPEAGPWLAGRLREALGLDAPGATGATGEALPETEPPVPSGWRARPRPEGGVVLDAPPARSRKTAGCALLAAFVVTAGAGVLLAAAFAGKGPSGVTGVAIAATVVATAVDALCLWAAFARDAWVLGRGRVERVRRFGPWSGRRGVRNGTLVASLSTDDDRDDWFTLEARGEGGTLRLARSMNSGPEVLAFARFAAWHSGFPLELPREVREAAGEVGEG
ncbi:MAG: hypothetical protein U0529_23320 [Thermoanaerobaculia bacterium]